MSETSFTPGPWEVTNLRDAYGEAQKREVWHVNRLNHARTTARVPIRQATLQEDKANANLIAAAPDMYAELKDILEWAQHERAPLRPQEIESIKRVLAAARGEVSK